MRLCGLTSTKDPLRDITPSPSSSVLVWAAQFMQAMYHVIARVLFYAHLRFHIFDCQENGFPSAVENNFLLGVVAR